LNHTEIKSLRTGLPHSPWSKESPTPPSPTLILPQSTNFVGQAHLRPDIWSSLHISHLLTTLTRISSPIFSTNSFRISTLRSKNTAKSLHKESHLSSMRKNILQTNFES
jgi:hypothetical protein